MQSKVDECTKTEERNLSATNKLHAVVDSFRAKLFAGTNLAPDSGKTVPSVRCQVADSPFALPPLKLTDAKLNDKATQQEMETARQVALAQSNAELKKLVGNERLKQCLTVLSKLPTQKAENFLLTTDAILDDTKANPGAERRRQLATELIAQVAHPEKIKQGLKGTCAVAGVEVDVAVAQPDSYARAIYSWSKLVDTSAHASNDDVDAIVHNSKAVVERDDTSHQRSLVSRIFQAGTANLALATVGQRYEGFSVSEAPDIKSPQGAFKPDRDTGERVIDPAGKVLTWNGLSADDQARLLTQLTPDNYVSEKIYPTSAKDLMNKLSSEIMRDGAPVNVGISTVYAGHALTVTKVDANDKSNEISYINTATTGAKVLKMSAQRFYDATIAGDDVVRIGAAGQIDGMTYRKAFKLAADAHPYVSVVHRDTTN